MSNITEFKQLSLYALLGEVSEYKLNPAGIMSKILNRAYDITVGNVDIVDPSNPFIYLLEASCVNTAMAIQENIISTRKLYPRLSQTDEDLYLHMSDKDYLDRFATPATATLEIFLSYNDFVQNAVEHSPDRTKRVVMARDTQIRVDKYTFTLLYPIIISQHYSGVINVRYDETIQHPVQSLEDSVIEFDLRADGGGQYWISFKVPVKELNISSTEIAVEASRTMNHKLPFQDNFYFARVFYKSSVGNGWVEILTTHTDQVYNPQIPTAVLKVEDKTLNVFIPPVYVINEQISGVLRVDIYTTNGIMDASFSNVTYSDYKITSLPIDEERDITSYTDAFTQISSYIGIKDRVLGGTAQVSFDNLKKAVIDKSIGDRLLPITNRQLSYSANRNGFEIIPNIDVVTNRVFLATKAPPKALTRYPITTITVTMNEYVNTLDAMVETGSVLHVSTNRYIVPTKTVFTLTNAILELVPKSDVELFSVMAKDELVSKLNSYQYLATPFHTVLEIVDNSLDMRAYDLAYTKIEGLHFLYLNETLQFIANTGVLRIDRIDSGYNIYIAPKIKLFRENVNYSNLSVYLVYEEKAFSEFYAAGVLDGINSDGEPLFKFNIASEGEIDSLGNIYVSGFSDRTGRAVTVPLSLNQKLSIIYIINDIPNTYEVSQYDKYLEPNLMGTNVAVLTVETVKVVFGLELKYLWRNTRSSIEEQAYEQYTSPVLLTHESSNYEIDPLTGMTFSIGVDGEIVYNTYHAAGDPILDDAGGFIFKYNVGDIKLDGYGKPIPIGNKNTIRHLSLFLFDYRSFVANETDYVAYLARVISTYDSWLTVDLDPIQNEALENTSVYFSPKKSVDVTSVLTKKDVYANVNTLQKFTVDVYVKDAIFMDKDKRSLIEYEIIRVIDTIVSGSRVALSDITVGVMAVLSGVIEAVDARGLGGDEDLDIVVVDDPLKTLSIAKKLVVRNDGKLGLVEDIDIRFVNIEKSLV